jgi:hypothetical protein
MWNGPANLEDYATSLALDSAGNVYVTGITYYGLNNGDYATVKYTSFGVQEWVQLYNGPGNGNDRAGSIAVDKRGNVYVTGSSMGLGTGYDYATVKYSQLVGINPVTSEIPREYKLYQNYPNPFNPVTKITFALPKSTFVKLQVYDILGRKIKELVNEYKQPGVYNVEFNGENFASGIYFYKLETLDYVKTNKMLLLR